MTRTTYEAIKARATEPYGPIGPHQLTPVVVCVNFAGEVVNPDDCGAETAAEFKARAEMVGMAIQDRRLLIEFIDQGFDIDWPVQGGKG